MKRALSLISLLISATILSGTDYANAQGVMGPPIIVPMPNRDVCGGYSDQWSVNCRRDSRGNMIDGNTGNTYDPYGNPIRQNRRTENPVQPSRVDSSAPAGINTSELICIFESAKYGAQNNLSKDDLQRYIRDNCR